ncbi:hypothetical protein KQX54_015999 [Cotesia glomerata]|uniref:Odorant receptor n=1 Tax=Cotesia glomerata TaxID=32391 RepID=A0AAV7HXR3_COTGL|nr:hypothetical protein KQX54_015999 [Cotesia glomerata]
MNLFDDLYWRATRIHLSVIGAWPFQSYITRIIIRTVVCFLFESLYISEIIKLVEVSGDLKLTLECIPILVLHSITQVKILNVHINLNKIKNLLLRIKSDWESGLLDESEIEFLRNDGRRHKEFMSLYFIILYSSTISYELMPLIPVALDIILPLNESRARIFLYQAEYFVEPEKNLTFIYIHSYIVSPLIAITFIGTDSLYSAFIQHACSMFTIIGRRLQNLRADGSSNKNRKSFKTTSDVKNIIICIKMHKNVLEFVRLLEEHYTNYLLVILGILVLGLSAIGFRKKDMNVFDEAFWRSTKMHLVASGAWPFQRPLYGILLRCMVFSFVESIMILEIIRLFYVAGDLMMTLTVLPVILYVAVIIQVSTKRLLLIVKNCWESDLLDKIEIELLRSDGRKHARKKVNCNIHSDSVLYCSQPAVYALTTLAPIILDITSPLNETRERFFVFAEMYGVDAQEYAFYIHIHHFAALSVFTWAFVAFKANYCTLIQHA